MYKIFGEYCRIEEKIYLAFVYHVEKIERV